MIGKHKKVLKELEGRSEVEVKVKVQRVSTCVELVKETSNEGQEVRMVPKRDAGIYVLGGTLKHGDPGATLSSVERYDVAQNRAVKLAGLRRLEEQLQGRRDILAAGEAVRSCSPSLGVRGVDFDRTCFGDYCGGNLAVLPSSAFQDTRYPWTRSWSALACWPVMTDRKQLLRQLPTKPCNRDHLKTIINNSINNMITIQASSLKH
eukprot:g79180.t1